MVARTESDLLRGMLKRILKLEQRRYLRPRPVALIGVGNKGVTTAQNATWTDLNTGPSDGTNVRNDGFTYGPGNIDVPKPGLYSVTVTVRFGSSTGGEARIVRLSADGGSSMYGQTWLRLSAWVNQNQQISASALVPIQSYLQISAYQNSGAAMSIVVENVTMLYEGPLT